MVRINLISPIFGTSGYAAHGRNLLLAMDEIGMDVAAETQIPSLDWERHVSEKLRQLILKDYRNADIQILNMPPPSAYLKSGDRQQIYQYAIMEGTRICTGWRLALNEPFIKHIICPSTDAERAVRSAGVYKPRSVVSHGVNIDVFNPEVKPSITDDNFKFVWCKGWAQGVNDRSGLDIFLRAFANEFKEDEKVKAIVKINPVYARIDYIMAIRNLTLSRSLKNQLTVDYGIIPENKLASLYKSGDVFVACSKGDGFDMPAAEAMSCGVPVIASGHSGHTDFVKEDNGWIIRKGKFLPATDLNLMYEECKWFNIDVDALQEKLRYCFEHPEEVKKKGKTASELIHGEFKWTDSARKIKEIIEK